MAVRVNVFLVAETDAAVAVEVAVEAVQVVVLLHVRKLVEVAALLLVLAVAEVVLIRVLTGAEIPVPEIVRENVKTVVLLPVMQIVILRVPCSVTEVQNRKDL